MTHVGVHVQQAPIQLSLVNNLILVNQHVGWPQPITPLVAWQPTTIPYPMCYNIVPFFLPMDFNVYSMYYSRIKGPDPLISGRKKRVCN